VVVLIFVQKFITPTTVLNKFAIHLKEHVCKVFGVVATRASNYREYCVALLILAATLGLSF
jgi:hypothetical protein